MPDADTDTDTDAAGAQPDDMAIVHKAFATYLDPVPGYALERVELVDDAETGERFWEVVVSVGADAASDETVTTTPETFVRPLFQAYARLVVEAGVEYPLEAVLCLRQGGASHTPFLAFRVAVLWVREHAHGNYSLEETVDRVLGTLTKAEGDTLADLAGWVPEYDRDWRQQEPMLAADDYPAATPYDHWAGRPAAKPGEPGHPDTDADADADTAGDAGPAQDDTEMQPERQTPRDE